MAMIAPIALAALLAVSKPPERDAFAPLPGPAALLESGGSKPLFGQQQPWPNCPFLLASTAHPCAEKTCALIDPETRPVGLSEQRDHFAARIPGARLLGFDDKSARVRFQPETLTDPDHQPGLLEDAVIEAAIRSRIAASPLLQSTRFQVECRSGSASITGAPDSVEQALELAKLALAADSVREVSIELPAALRWPPGTEPPVATPGP